MIDPKPRRCEEWQAGRTPPYHRRAMSEAHRLPEPLAQGDLSRTPFAHALLYIEKQGLSGTLVVWQPQSGDDKPKQDRVLFEGGVLVAARLSAPASRLDRGLLPLFARASGPYAFYEAIDLVGAGEGVRRGPLELLPLIAASLRGSSRDDVVLHVCAGFGQSKLRLSDVDLYRLGLLSEERALLELLRDEPMTVARLAARSTLPPRMAERLVYLLALTKSIAAVEDAPEVSPEPEEPAEEPSPPEAEPPAAHDPASLPPPPPELSAEHRALWEEIRARVAAIDDETYFDMLGVPRDAPAAAVQKAYFHLVKKWHPDRLPKELAALRPSVEHVFQHLTQAQQVLSSEEARGPYLASVQDGGGTPASERRLAAIIQAAMDYRKVEVMVRRRELAPALALLDQILSVNDEEPDYHATRGWIVFQQSPNDDAMRPVVLASLDRAIALSPKHDKAHYYKGMVLERAGRHADAAECFRRAAELNPKNIDAQRMVRLADMRGTEAGSSGKSEDKRDSIFGKLFGSSKKK